MKTTISALALAAALLGLGTAAMAADDAMAKPDAMMKPDTTMATMLRRPAMANEKSNAMIGTKSVVCKPIDSAAMMSMKKSVEAMPGGEPLWLKMFQEYHIGANGV